MGLGGSGEVVLESVYMNSNGYGLCIQRVCVWLQKRFRFQCRYESMRLCMYVDVQVYVCVHVCMGVLVYVYVQNMCLCIIPTVTSP